MRVFHYISGYPKELVRDAKLIKQAGVKCTEIAEQPIVEVGTGKIVHMCYDLTFRGNIFQCWKANRIIKKLVHQD